MSNCIYLKKRKNKPYCNIIKKEITLSQCRECDNKEYKSPKIVKSTFKTPCKSVVFSKNRAKLQNKDHFPDIRKMVVKSKKLAKLERNRFSVFTDDDKCFVCNSKYLLTWNEIYRGKNRANSMVYGFCLRMCITCHRKYQEDIKFNDYWHKKAQHYWESNIGSKEQFIATFRRNYLK